MIAMESQAWTCDGAPKGVIKLSYKSAVDGISDWALTLPPAKGNMWVVDLHGHGSSGDQIFTRPDIRDAWLGHCMKRGYGVLSPNLRGNAWMCPEAVVDLHDLLATTKARFKVGSFVLASGSMGGTGNLIYATRHPEDVQAVAALCPATNIATYQKWCLANPGGVRDEIRLAIESAYRGTPETAPERYANHIVTDHCQALTMPLLFSHATGDDLIPVAQCRELSKRLAGMKTARYIEFEGGNHDTPLHGSGMLEWLDEQFVIVEGASR